MFGEIQWHDPSVQAAIISAAGTLLSAIVAAVCATIVGQKIAGRKKLVDKLERAYGDIDFLLEVEAQHCAMHIDHGLESNKRRVRTRASEEGYSWSGRNTPGTRTPPK